MPFRIFTLLPPVFGDNLTGHGEDDAVNAEVYGSRVYASREQSDDQHA